ncbi:hypothetical protein [Citricoccus sp.]|uniref:hypothetical protein n=1 Tax=Citricoccus sp. TaxID=1978372 RepID=UPI0028BE6C7D|nr:hypothetical protein [Citricoccus sp.]
MFETLPGGQHVCTRCDALTAAGIHLCHACTTTLEEVLDRVPEALTTVQTTVARLDRMGTTGRATGNRVEAVNVSALDEKIDLTEKLQSWARMVLELDDRQGLQDIAPTAYLRMSTHIIRSQDWAGDLLDELNDALRAVERVFDKPADRRVWGPCSTYFEDGSMCMSPLSAEQGAEWVSCRECGTQHSTAWRERLIREQVKGNPMPAKACREWITKNVGVKIKTQDFKNWVYIGALSYVLERVTTAGRPTRLFFPGDVLQVHQRMQQRRRLAA